MAEYLIQDTTLTGIADAIRDKTGGTDPIMVSDFASQIAGIVASSGESNIKFAFGTFTPTADTSNGVISHNLGCVPDVFCVCASDVSSVKKQFLAGWGFSTAFGTELGTIGQFCSWGTATTPYSLACNNANIGIDTTTTPMIRLANETTITVGLIAAKLYSDTSYYWFAIGGLT